jgi:hypothetical protein
MSDDGELNDNTILAWMDKNTGKSYAVTVHRAREILRAEFPHWSDDQIDREILRAKLPDE